ncbi:MAG: DNA polymerase III subunit alpha [Candidatus Rokubacteria bacterium]|nr:DNA polymerase III subunit alpha [Candidatus Rokubacteria bacterium]
MFVELHAQSAFSFLEGAEQPEALVAEAARREMPALALVDRDGVYGAPRFHRAALAAGLRPIVGGEITLVDGSRLPLLVEDREGYQNLSRLITRMKLGAPKGSAALRLDDLEPYAAGLVCLTGGPRGPLARDVAAGRYDAARDRLARLVAIFGRSSCFVEIQRHLDRAEERTLQRLVDLARAAGVPLVATNQPLSAGPGGRALADVFTCIREKTDLDHAGRRLSVNDERGLKGAGDMARLFRDLPRALEATGELAMRLAFTLKDLGYRFPGFPLPPAETPLEHLRQLVDRGVRARYGTGPLAARARRQVAHELDVIGRLDLAGYFLIVWDIVEFCRAHEILVQGRGSAANSAVCYALGITAVDPVGMELLFERFLSEARGEWPDIDLDLPSGDRREAVIQYGYRRYGRLGAGMTANVITYRGRSAAREVGKALGLPRDMQDRLAGLVANWGYRDPADVLTRHLAAAGCDTRHPRIRKFAALWTRIQDLPRHLGQHSGGMVIAAGRLDDVVPLEPATMPGRVVIQWDKDDCAALGIIKIDLLGLGMMSVLQDAIRLVGETGGAVDLAHLPPDDPDVYRALQRADTIGVFQVESRAQMATLPRIHPERFYDLVVQVAIIRPGPIVGDMVHPYIRRRRGREPVTYAHPSLEPILRRTLGVPLFQEQLLRMAMATAGFTGSEAEELRRAFGFKRSEARMAEVELKLRAGMARQGIDGAAAEAIVRAITAFALYGFPECVVGETRVIDADTGRWVTIEDVVSGRARLETTLACDANMRVCRRRVLKATPSGRRTVYRLRTALGRTLVATAEHPLLTASGWRTVADLGAGDHVAAARALPALGRKHWPRHELIVLADLIAEGNLCHPSTFYFYTTDPRHCAEFVATVQRFDNTRATVARHRQCYSVHVRRRDRARPAGAVVWAKRLGLWGFGARQKHFPEEVFELHATDLALLLARLWEGDGSLSLAGHASYDTSSRRLAEEVQHLLLRLGIVSRLYERSHPYRGRRVTSFVVTVTGRENLGRFYHLIARRFLDRLRRRQAQALVGPHVRQRSSRDVIPVGVKGLVDHERKRRSSTWDDIGDGTGLSMRALVSPDGSKRGYRRWVIARLAQYFRSPQLARLAHSDLYWDRIVAIEPVDVRETYDLHVEGTHNFLANDLVVHNSHASSFALLAYASAFLKTHHPAAFYAALLNNQPMGFYHPATIVKDAQRHGQRILPIDVTRSQWLCTIEPDEGGGHAVRLGLRYVKGLRESAAQALVRAREARPFASIHDLALRAGLERAEVETLAAIGALAPLGGTRRANLWTAAVPHPGPVFGETFGAPDRDQSPLRDMTEAERLVADYAGTGVTLGRHPMAMRRAELRRRGVLSARELALAENETRVRVAGSVIVRQRPGTAKGFVFLSLEDETGIANVIVTPDLFARYRVTLVTAPFLLVEGAVQHQDGVVSVRAQRVEALPALGHAVPSHDFG